MRLTPIAKLFIAVVIIAVLGYTGWHYYNRHEQAIATQAATPASAPSSGTSPTAAAGAPAVKAAPNVLRLHGSNTIGSSLAPSLARGLLKKLGAGDVSVDESQRKEERVSLRGRAGDTSYTVEIFSPGSQVAFEDLGSGGADVGMASRAIKPDEARRLQAIGDMNDPSCEHVIALDGIAIIVNRKNPVAQLGLDDVAQLFTGAVADWSHVGGKAGAVHVYTRDRKSGTFDSFASTVLRGRALKADAKSFDDSESLAAAVAADDGGIGFVGLSLVGGAKAVAIHEAGAQPLYPTVFTVATEDYPLSRRLRLYTPATPTALAQKLVDFTLSEEGQRLVEQAGFVALTVRTERPALPGNAPSAYKKETSGAERLSLNFRFRTGSSALDNKGQADLDRLIAFLAQPEQRTRKIRLLGFADNQGGAGVNQELSRQRAQAIAVFLAPRGVVPASVVGLGSALPVAPNDTPDGRDRNRRVEVWLR